MRNLTDNIGVVFTAAAWRLKVIVVAASIEYCVVANTERLMYVQIQNYGALIGSMLRHRQAPCVVRHAVGSAAVLSRQVVPSFAS